MRPDGLRDRLDALSRVYDARFLDSDPVDVELPPSIVTDITIPLKRAR